MELDSWLFSTFLVHNHQKNPYEKRFELISTTTHLCTFTHLLPRNTKLAAQTCFQTPVTCHDSNDTAEKNPQTRWKAEIYQSDKSA